MNPPTAKSPILGIDLGGTKIHLACARLNGEVLAQKRIPTRPEDGPEKGLERILKVSEEILSQAQADAKDLAAVGLSIPGPWDRDAGTFLDLPNLPGWGGYPIRKALQDHFSVPIYMDNDANAAALAEWKFGAGRGYDDLIYLTMSTGLGGGLILGGRLYRGKNFNAGEVGHQVILPDGPQCGCGMLGHLEALCSGSGIARRMKEEVKPGISLMWDLAGEDPEKLTAEILAQAVRKRDPLARIFLQETLDYLATGLANLIFILNPEAVILGTIVAKNPDLFLEPLERMVHKRIWKVFRPDLKILAAQLTDQIGVYAPLAIVLEGQGIEPEEVS